MTATRAGREQPTADQMHTRYRKKHSPGAGAFSLATFFFVRSVVVLVALLTAAAAAQDTDGTAADGSAALRGGGGRRQSQVQTKEWSQLRSRARHLAKGGNGGGGGGGGGNINNSPTTSAAPTNSPTPAPIPAPPPTQTTVTVGPDGKGDYPDLPSALAAGASEIRILDGVHDVPATVEITRPVKIVGQSKMGTVLRKVGLGSFLLVVDTYGVTIDTMTLDAKTFDSDTNPIWEAVGCVNCNHTTLRNTVIHGSMNMFAIFFAGPGNQFDAGQPTIDAFNSDFLNVGNVVENNVVYSNFPGDVLSFSLQKNGSVTGNRVVGGVISFFMNKDSSCNYNTVSSSETAGIFVSVPAENNLLEGNTVLGSKSSGIVVRRQIDHRDGPDGVSGNIVTPLTYRAPGITIRKNHISDSRYFGIELDQAIGAIVEGNTVARPDFSSIYTLRSDESIITDNTLEDFGQCLHREPIWQWDTHQNSGIFCDYATVNSTISHNAVVNATSLGARFGIKISNWPESYGNVVRNNVISGSYSYVELEVPTPRNSAEDNLILPLA